MSLINGVSSTRAKMSFKLIPNCTPNLFPSPYKIHKILDKFLNNFKKLKLNLYQSENIKKSKRKWNSDDEMYYNQFIKDISISSENLYPHDDNLEEIIRTSPKTLSELKKVNGFGDIKCQKYGNDILKIISDNTTS